MASAKPYQPFLLRILHGVAAIFALLAIISSFLVYNTFDGRFGKLPISPVDEIIDIHGTLGLIFFLMFPIFAIYSFHAGQKRLVQSDSFQNITKLDRPIGWYSWQRITNTVMLLAATFSVLTGRLMQERWVANGDLTQPVYLLHLAGWLILVICLALHLLMSAKVGGMPLLLSIFDYKIRPDDHPRHWPRKVKTWFQR
jgi:thiosulfate reductase cytochrome b subunit